MGCPCLNKTTDTFRLNEQNSNSAEDCGYSVDTIVTWKSILECIKDTQTYSELGLSLTDVNIFLGNIISALNNSVCAFTSKLNQIQPYIVSAVNLNLCQA